MTQSRIFYGSGGQSTHRILLYQNETIAKLHLRFGADCTKPLLSRCHPSPFWHWPVQLTAPAPPAPLCFLCKHRAQLCTAAAASAPSPRSCQLPAARGCCPAGRALGQFQGCAVPRAHQQRSAPARWTAPEGRDVPDPCHKPTLTWLLLKKPHSQNPDCLPGFLASAWIWIKDFHNIKTQL